MLDRSEQLIRGVRGGGEDRTAQPGFNSLSTALGTETGTVSKHKPDKPETEAETGEIGDGEIGDRHGTCGSARPEQPRRKPEPLKSLI